MKSTWKDSEILNAIHASEQSQRDEALKQVYAHYYSMVRKFIVSNKGTEEDAADVFQDAIITWYNMVLNGKFRAESKIKTFIYAVSRNIWLKRLAKNSREVTMVADAMDAEMEPEMEDNVSSQELLKKAVHQLGEQCHEVLIGFYYHGMSMIEIKNRFDLGSEQAAKNKKYRCMQQLMKICQSMGITKEIVFG